MSYTTGKFKGRAIAGELGMASTGNEQVQVQFKILEGPDEGKDITWWGYFTEKTADRTLSSLALTGWDGEDVSVLNGLGTKDVLLVIEDDHYNGEKKQRVQWINALTRPMKPKNEMSQADKSAFAAKMRGRTLKLQQDIPAQAGVIGSDDIPF